MKAEDLKTKTPDELQKLLLDTRKAQFNQRFQRSNGQMEKTAEIRVLRRSVARIKTFMNAKPGAEKAAAKTKKATPAKTKAKSSKAAASKE
jgi:large subunit ribosomal protein L29